MIPNKLTICIVAGCLAAPAALAQHRGPQFPIDLAELKAQEEARFAAADSDSDGMVSADEFAALDPRQAMTDGPRHGARRGKRGSARPDGPQPGGFNRRFEAQDADGDSSVSLAEFTGPQSDLFQEADANGDGVLSEDEHAGLRAAARTLTQRRAFTRLDADGDHVLTPAEFPSRHSRLAAYDADGDGQVSRDEFPRRQRGRR
jgi:hypothetical protein